jgi:protein O-mannosyl-transferase
LPPASCAITPRFAGGFLFGLALTVLLIGVYSVYERGFFFGWGFDDEVHLSGLARVNGIEAATFYVFNGHAGPLGRPLALATFLLQSSSWPTAPDSFVRVNTLIHLLNGLLVIWLSYRLYPYLSRRPLKAEWFALLVGGAWMASPILLSTNMLVVQRMASLSALFVFLGLLLYLSGRERLVSHPWSALSRMGLGVAVGTLLACLCKENGVLLPLLALVMERCLLRHGKGDVGSAPVVPLWWVSAFMILPLMVVVWIMIRSVVLGGSSYPGRDFDLMQRLMTESRVLFSYARLILVPVRSELGPFQGLELSRGLLEPISTLVAVLGLGAAVALALCAARTKWRVLTFGISWFLVGHLLESSVFGLEIYFEHRNYTPSFGILFAAFALLTSLKIRVSYRVTVVALLVANQVFVLTESMRLWGDPMLASALWYRESPQSLRALQFQAYELGVRGQKDKVRELVHHVVPELQTHVSFQLYRLELSCDIDSLSETSGYLKSVLSSLVTEPLDTATSIQIARLAEQVSRGACDGVDRQHILKMFELVTLAGSRASPHAIAGAHYHLARHWMAMRDLDRTMTHLEAGFRLSPQIDVAVLMIDSLSSAELDQQALSLIDKFLIQAPRRPFVRNHWISTLEGERTKILAKTSAKVSGSPPRLHLEK